MALTAVDYSIFATLRSAGSLPERPRVLELGESEWYGDVSPDELTQAIERHVPEPQRRRELKARLDAILGSDSPHASWDLAKLFYAVFLDYSKITAIDFHGTPAALKLDLNEPIGVDEQFDVLLNGGTAEHVFNVFQFFKTCHEVTRPGGLMLHSAPFLGWLEHGFYNFNPTFFWDLALANDYKIEMLAYTEIDPPRVIELRGREQIIELHRSQSLGRNALLYAVFRKPPGEAQFRTPVQGFYAGNLNQELMEAWYRVR